MLSPDDIDGGGALLRSAPGQGDRSLVRPAQLHRQPRRQFLDGQCHSPDAEAGPHHRGHRRADRQAARLAELRPPSGLGRYGRRRRDDQRRQQFLPSQAAAHQGRAARRAVRALHYRARCSRTSGSATKPSRASTRRWARARTGATCCTCWTGRRSTTATATRPKFPRSSWPSRIEEHCRGAHQAAHSYRPGKATRLRPFTGHILPSCFTYAANRLSSDGSQPAEDIVAIDRAMKTGYNWELGPFEMMDAAGVRDDHREDEGAGSAGQRRTSRSCWPAAMTPGTRDDASNAIRPRLFRPAHRGLQACSRPKASPSLATIKKSKRRGEEELGRVADRSRQRRRGHRAALKDECAGRRHRVVCLADAEAGLGRLCATSLRFRHHGRL